MASGPQTCWRGKLSKAVAQLLLQAVAPELLAVLVGPEMGGLHDGEHLSEGELAPSLDADGLKGSGAAATGGSAGQSHQDSRTGKR